MKSLPFYRLFYSRLFACQDWLAKARTVMAKAVMAGEKGGNGQGYYGVPGPIAGAGLPVIAIGYGIYWLIRQRRRRKIN